LQQTFPVTSDFPDSTRHIDRIAALEAEVALLRAQSTQSHDRDILATILRATPIGIALVEHGITVWGNETLSRMVGGVQSIVGRPCAEVFLGSVDQEETLSSLYNAIEQGRSPLVETRLRNLEGAELAVAIQLAPIDPVRPRDAAVVIVLETSAQTRTMLAMQETRRQFEELTELLPVAYYEAELDGVISFANSMGMAMFGYDRQSLGSARLDDLVIESHAVQARQNLSRLLSGAPPAPREYVGKRKDGTVFPALVTSAVIWRGARPVGFRGVTTDLSSQRQREQLERRIGRIEKLEALGTLASGFAHDFNNLLFSILGHAELARRHAEGTGAVRHIDEVIAASEQARDLVRQVLTVGRRSAPPGELVSTATVVAEAVRLVRATLPESVQLTENLQSGELPIRIAAPQLKQVIHNLCANAVQAVEAAGGTVEVILREVRQPSELPLELASADAYVVIEVRDDGPGIPFELQQRIFDPYFTTKSTGKGTGLGLALVEGITRSYGGAVTLSSAPGKGATFRVFFPVAGERPQSVPLSTTRPRVIPRILVVDDEAPVAEIVSKMLRMLSYTVVTCTDPREALRLVSDPHEFISLVVSDIAMPEIDGRTLAAEIHDLRPELPVVLCSGQVLGDEKDPNAIAVLAKPIALPVLGRAVQEALERSLPSTGTTDPSGLE